MVVIKPEVCGDDGWDPPLSTAHLAGGNVVCQRFGKTWKERRSGNGSIWRVPDLELLHNPDLFSSAQQSRGPLINFYARSGF